MTAATIAGRTVTTVTYRSSTGAEFSARNVTGYGRHAWGVEFSPYPGKRIVLPWHQVLSVVHEDIDAPDFEEANPAPPIPVEFEPEPGEWDYEGGDDFR